MRFKRLRIILGISIVIFILVVVNIFIFRGFENKAILIPQDKSKLLKVGQKTELIHPKITTNSQNNFSMDQQPTSPQVIRHTFRTRAS